MRKIFNNLYLRKLLILILLIILIILIVGNAIGSTNIAYIYPKDDVIAESYKSFLNSEGYSVDLFKKDDLYAAEIVLGGVLSKYDVIIIGPERGYYRTSVDYEDYWLEHDEKAEAIIRTGKPIIALKYGGISCIGRFSDIYINEDTVESVGHAGIFVVNNSHPIFNFPNKIPKGEVIRLTSSSGVGLNSKDKDIKSLKNIDLLAVDANELDRYPIVIQSGRFFLWGFGDPPNEMTQYGKDLFINVVTYLSGEPPNNGLSHNSSDNSTFLENSDIPINNIEINSDSSKNNSTKGQVAPERILGQIEPFISQEGNVFQHQISVQDKNYLIYDVFWNNDSIPWIDNDYKFSIIYDPTSGQVITAEDLVNKCLLVEAFYKVVPQNQNIWIQQSESYAKTSEDFAKESQEAADNLAKISVLSVTNDGYKTFVFGDVGSMFNIVNLLLDSAKNWCDPSTVAGPKLKEYLEVDSEPKMQFLALESIEATIDIVSNEMSENPDLETSLSESLKVSGDLEASYTGLITTITDEVTEPCKNIIRYVELRSTLYLGYLAILSAQASSSAEVFSQNKYSYEDVVFYLGAYKNIPSLFVEMWGFVEDGILDIQKHFGTAWMVNDEMMHQIEDHTQKWVDLDSKSMDYVGGILNTRDFMAARYYEHVLGDNSKIIEWPLFELSNIGSNGICIKNLGSATAQNIGLYNNGREPIIAQKQELKPGEEVQIECRENTEYIKVTFNWRSVDIVDYLYV